MKIKDLIQDLLDIENLNKEATIRIRYRDTNTDCVIATRSVKISDVMSIMPYCGQIAVEAEDICDAELIVKD